MGNTLSNFRLLKPHPSSETIHLATVGTNIISARSIVYLNVVDVQADTAMPYYIKRSLKLQGVVNFVAKTEGYPVQELEMRIGGTLIGTSATAQMLGLKDGTKLEISRRAPVNAEAESMWADRDAWKSVQDEATMKALLNERFERKSALVRDTFGYHWPPPDGRSC